MPNYEELYNIAKQKYNNAVSSKNALQSKLNSLNNQKNSLLLSLETKKDNLLKIQEKKAKVVCVLSKVDSILDKEYSVMKSRVELAGSDYIEVINVGVGNVANLSGIYDSDFTSTKTNLDSIRSEFQSIKNTLDTQEQEAQTAVNNCKSEIDSVNSQINNAGSISTAQWYVNMYYSEMKEYERRMNE